MHTGQGTANIFSFNLIIINVNVQCNIYTLLRKETSVEQYIVGYPYITFPSHTPLLIFGPQIK